MNLYSDPPDPKVQSATEYSSAPTKAIIKLISNKNFALRNTKGIHISYRSPQCHSSSWIAKSRGLATEICPQRREV